MSKNKVIFHFIIQIINLTLLSLGLIACQAQAQPNVAATPQVTPSLQITSNPTPIASVIPTAIPLPTPLPTSTPMVKMQNVPFNSFSRKLPPDIRQQSEYSAGGGGDASVETFIVFINCALDQLDRQKYGENNEIGWMGNNWFLICGWQPNEQVTITIKLANGIQTQSTIIADYQGRIQFNGFIEEDSPLGAYTFIFQGASRRITRDLTVVVPPGKQQVLGKGVFWFAIRTNSYCQTVGFAPVYGTPTKAVILSAASGGKWEDCLWNEIKTEIKPLQHKIQRLFFYGFDSHEQIRLIAYSEVFNSISWQEVQMDENGRLFLKLEDVDITNIGRIAVIGESSGEIGCYPSLGACWPEENYSTNTKVDLPNHTPVPTVEIFTSTIKPDQFIIDYYSELNNRHYDVTWSKLSPRFQDKKNHKDFTGYANFWAKSVKKVEVMKINIQNSDAQRPILHVALQIYQTKNCILSEEHVFSLIFDTPRNTWLIDTQDILSSVRHCR